MFSITVRISEAHILDAMLSWFPLIFISNNHRVLYNEATVICVEYSHSLVSDRNRNPFLN